MQIVRTKTAARSNIKAIAVRAALAGGCALLLSSCNTDQQVAGVPDVPTDYRQRHPITMTETERTLEVFVGTSRGELDPTQRAEVLAFAQTWRREATGGVVVAVPVGTSNERASAQAVHGIRSILAATGLQQSAIAVRPYHPPGLALAPIRITYPHIAAQAGPCGIWPADIGPSYTRDHFENQPMWNNGCATQRNLAAMVANPADLVQPRAEAPAYEMRRTTVLDKYTAGQPTGSQAPADAAAAAKISDLGK